MDILLESLEELLDGLGSSSYEVEYHVRVSANFSNGCGAHNIMV
jgi:hypothetical protein